MCALEKKVRINKIARSTASKNPSDSNVNSIRVERNMKGPPTMHTQVEQVHEVTLPARIAHEVTQY